MSAKVKPHIAAGVPVLGITGVNGVGKTSKAVEIAIAEMRGGRTVYSTVQVDYLDKKTRELFSSVPLVSLRQLLEVEDALVLLDDIAVIFASSTSTSSLPHEIVVFLQTARHRRVTIIWTAPTWMRAHKLVREATQANLHVAPLLRPKSATNPWPTALVVMLGLLDTSDGKVDEAPTKVMRRRLQIPSRSVSWGAYDTHAPTPVIGHQLLTGVCADCGGSMARPKHDQARHEALGLPWYPEEELARSGVRSALAGGADTPEPAAPEFVDAQ